ncbi:hypothetical protein H7H52_14745 [Mycolicibacter hiberniae]|uniref:Uncharacterized protein n=3 Tax=Mycolicibacter hiberniae TaxID=29314 RepID=A0A7I7WW26_9MYCO|nr:hypothetical protein [Mycolicibacter hiberniae]ORV67988.1 hypothetical protein AWC09_17865 [Mycolicibacter hiberniae]BBZ21724.1 hypothetical protein MHIB_01420 [Mycolicibacter hiberniae]
MPDEPLLWPRMDRSMAEKRLAVLGETSGPEIDLTTEHFSFSSVGRRAGRAEIEALRGGIVEIATQYGFNIRYGYDQDGDAGDEARRRFDAEVFAAFAAMMPMNWSEAGSRDLWSWCAIALLPDITHWRWKWRRQSGRWNLQRWIGSDLTRHTWGRQWWRAVQLEAAPELAERIQEGEFNQLTERADTIGANPLLVSTFAQRFLKCADGSGISRRDLLRDATQRLLREMYFIDDSLMSESDLVAWSDRVLETSVTELLRVARAKD